jgi:hypothetical protein
LIFSELPTNNIDGKYKKLIFNKIYEVVLTKKLSGLDKSDYVKFFLKSRGSEFEDKLFDYILSNYKLEQSECFSFLKKELKQTHKKSIVDYIVSNFDLDMKLSKYLMKYPFSYNYKKMLFQNILNTKNNYVVLHNMYFNNSTPFTEQIEEELMNLSPKRMINYLQKRTFIFE